MKELKNREKDFSIICGDILSNDILEEVIAKLGQYKNPLWVLVNNASLRLRTDMFSETKKSWTNQIEVNLWAPFFWMQGFLNYALHNKKSTGFIINVSSVASQFTTFESPAYHAAKAGLESLSRYFAIHAPRLGANFMVCVLRIGFLLKEENLFSFGSEENRIYANNVRNYMPTKDIPSGKDVGETILAIVSSENTLLNGSILELDGGANKQDQWFVTRYVMDNDKNNQR
jgi:3-oxoacyl-[acyl-carrier protein] reductase